MPPVCATPTSQALEREDFGTVTVLRVKVPLLWGDEKTEELFTEILSLTHGADRANLVLNLDRVVLLASMALGKLILLMRRVRAGGGKLVLCKVPPTIENLLQTTHLADVLPGYRDEQEAVSSF